MLHHLLKGSHKYLMCLVFFPRTPFEIVRSGVTVVIIKMIDLRFPARVRDEVYSHKTMNVNRYSDVSFLKPYTRILSVSRTA